MRPIDVVRRLCPHARASYIDAFATGDELFLAAGITTPARLAHFLAQALHETDGLTIDYESGNYSADRLLEIFGAEPRRANGAPHHSAQVTPAEAQKLAHNPQAIFERVYGLGNPQKARELGNTQAGDGYRYRGTGILQTTGRGNFRRMGQKCSVDFEGHPELVLSAEHALKPALAEWTEGKLNAAADQNDIIAITKKINGGTNGLESRQAWLARVRPLIDKVELISAAPKPVPAPAPLPPVVRPKEAAGMGAIIAFMVAALQAHEVSTAIGLLILGILIALGIHFFWPNKKDPPS